LSPVPINIWPAHLSTPQESSATPKQTVLRGPAILKSSPEISPRLEPYARSSPQLPAPLLPSPPATTPEHSSLTRHHVRNNKRHRRHPSRVPSRRLPVPQPLHQAYVPSTPAHAPTSSSAPDKAGFGEQLQLTQSTPLADKREFIKISQAVGFGFVIMGAIGYIIKLST
jgi:hypothetical protein